MTAAIAQTTAAWADRIRPHLVGAVENILAAGRELNEAKAALPHGAFGPLLAELGLSRHMANRFMRVAANNVIAKCAPVHGLPAAVSVLDALAKLDDDVLEELIVAGEITPSTTRNQATEIVNRANNPRAWGLPPSSDWWVDCDRWLNEWAETDRPPPAPGDRDLLRRIVVAQLAARHLWREAELLPEPGWWPTDADPFHADVTKQFSEFVMWMRSVGINETFEKVFLADGPEAAMELLDHDGLARWEPDSWWSDATEQDRRLAAVGQWFFWSAGRCRPVVETSP